MQNLVWWSRVELHTTPGCYKFCETTSKCYDVTLVREYIKISNL